MTSAAGQAEVMSHTSPKGEYDMCSMLGHANETMVSIGGVDCLALVDTGSQISTVSEAFYNSNLADRYPLHDVAPDVRVEGAGGTSLSFAGVAEVELCFDGVEEPLMVPVLVMPTTPYNQRVPAIIGTNVLTRIRDASSASAAVRSSVDVISQQNAHVVEDVHLYSSGYVTLAPCKMTVITARIGASSVHSHGVPVTVESLPGGVGIPHTVVSLDGSKDVKLCLFNLNSHEVYIPRLQRVATVQPVRVVETMEPGASGVASSYARDASKSRDVKVNLKDTELSESQQEEVMTLLRKYADVFAHSRSELGTAKGVELCSR